MQAPIWARLVIWSLVLGAFVVGVAGETVLASPSVGDISTVAGNGNLDFSGDGGQATAASFRFPSCIAVDGQGNLFIADKDNSRIRRVDASSGIITTVVGNGINGFSGDGGLATGASLNLPWGIVLDSHGNLFIADTDNRRVRRVDASIGIITTVAGDGATGFSGDGSSATAASLSYPQRLALDGQRNLFIVDRDNQRVRRVDAATGIITTVAGNGSIGSTGDGGPSTSASFNFPVDIALDSQGYLLIADNTNHLVRRVEAIGLAAPAPLPALGPWVLAALAVAMAGLMLWRQVGLRPASP